LVEDVKVPLVLDLPDHTTLFKEVVCDLGSDRFSVVIEHNFEILALNTAAIRRH
jgi:hypothetical protein